MFLFYKKKKLSNSQRIARIKKIFFINLSTDVVFFYYLITDKVYERSFHKR